MGLTLISQPAQAITWNFKFEADNVQVDQIIFDGTLTTDGTAVTPGQIYNVTDADGSLFYNGSTASQTFTNLGASGNFQWDGTQILLNFDDGILFNDLDRGPIARIYCNTDPSCMFIGEYGSSDFFANIPGDGSGAPDLGVTSSSMSPAAVPWETDALSVIGATTLFGFGVWTKRKRKVDLSK